MPISELVTSVLLHHIQRCVQADGNAGLPFVDRLLLSLIFHCSKDEDQSRAMRDMAAGFSCTSIKGQVVKYPRLTFGWLVGVKNADCELPKVSITACLTVRFFFTVIFRPPINLNIACVQLLWQFGDRHYHAKKWNVAVDWFLGGTHQLFRSLAQGSMKCFRKAALCYIQQREYASASALIRQCPGNEAATHYVALLTAVKQGEKIHLSTS